MPFNFPCPYVPNLCIHPGAVLAKNSGGGEQCPISPFITESIVSVLRNREKYELHIGLYLKSIISRIVNSVMG